MWVRGLLLAGIEVAAMLVVWIQGLVENCDNGVTRWRWECSETLGHLALALMIGIPLVVVASLALSVMRSRD